MQGDATIWTYLAVPLLSLLCWVFLASPLAGSQWQRARPPSVNHQRPGSFCFLCVLMCQQPASRLVQFVRLSTDLSITQWWCKLLCGLWFPLQPQAWPVLGASSLVLALCRWQESPHKSPWPLLFTPSYWCPECWALPQLWHHPCAFCSPSANL